MSRRRHPLRRRAEIKPLPEGIVVACEGQTEKDFLDKLRQRYKLSAAQVVVVGSAGDPVAVVLRAESERKKRTERARLPRPPAYAVFDRDEHRRFADALSRARDLDVLVAVSNPCVELWFIWMVKDLFAPLHRDEAHRECKASHPGYCHTRNPYIDLPRELEEAIGVAQQRARTARIRHRGAGDDEHHNPSSAFGVVVEALLALRGHPLSAAQDG